MKKILRAFVLPFWLVSQAVMGAEAPTQSPILLGRVQVTDAGKKYLVLYAPAKQVSELLLAIGESDQPSNLYQGSFQGEVGQAGDTGAKFDAYQFNYSAIELVDGFVGRVTVTQKDGKRFVERIELGVAKEGETVRASFVKQLQNAPTAGSRTLADLVRRVGGRSAHGYEDPNLCRIAQNTANENARAGRLMHLAAPEIIAVSYPRGWSQNPEADCVDGWLSSSGHRQSMMSSWSAFCYASAYSPRTQRTYCAGVFR